MKTLNYLYNLENSMDTLGTMFDFAVNTCKINGDDYWNMFVCSGIAEQFEQKNPKYVAGKSGEEIVYDVVNSVGISIKDITEDQATFGRSAEYWVGWALAQYQSETNTSYKVIHQLVGFSDLTGMYKTLHEAPIEKFIDILENRKKLSPTNLRLQRERMGLSQSQLANLSGVNLKTIQAFEQRQKDIKSAKFDTLQKLSSTLGCEIADLI